MRKLFIIFLLCATIAIPGCKKEPPAFQAEPQIIEQDNQQLSSSFNAEIEKYLNMTVEEIINSTGAEIDEFATLMVFNMDVFFPCIYHENSPFFVICRSYDETLTPLYVSLYADSLNEFLNTMNLNDDMIFSDIMAVLGPADIDIAQPSLDEGDEDTDSRRMYKIEYDRDALRYAFCSDNEYGKKFDLFIGLTINSDIKNMEEIKLSDSNLTTALESSDAKRQIPDNTLSFDPEKYGTAYAVAVTDDANYNYTMHLFDGEFNELQTIPLEDMLFFGMEFADVNCDGYTDIVVNTGGTMNETHILFIWDAASKNLVRVVFDGFEMLSYFEVNDGYIKNWLKDSLYKGSVQTLVWDGNTLVLESEEEYEIGEFDREDAFRLVADEYYDGDTSDLWVTELGNNNYVVFLGVDFGSGLITTLNSHLVVDGQIITSLFNEDDSFNEFFYQIVDEYRE